MFSKLKHSWLNRLDVKLTISYTLIVLLITGSVSGFFFYRLKHNLIKQVDRMLHDELNELIQMFKDEGDIVRACRKYETYMVHRKYFPVYFTVSDASGELIYRSTNTLNTEFPPSVDKTRKVFTLKIAGKSSPLRFLKKKFTLDNIHAVSLCIAMDTKQVERILENPTEVIVIVALIVLSLSIGAGVLIARKPCSVMKHITQIARRITSQNLKERLPVPSAHDEIRDLVMTINTMMDRLEKSFNDMKQFTSDVSHELRTPLFALKGEMEVALSQKRDAQEYREALYECLERINYLIKMTNDLFLISRFDAKKIQLELDYVNIGKVVQDLFDFFLPMAQNKHITFTLEQCDDVITLADKTKLPQLVSNLLDNAIKFTPENETVRVTLKKNNGAVELQVRDTGIGIPEKNIPLIFNRFYQVEQSRTGFYRGTGLGLQICKRIVEAHGGTIRAQRNEVKGVTFMVTIPIRE